MFHVAYFERGVDQDAYAFSSFIKQFLSKCDRWNSPKYLLGDADLTTGRPDSRFSGPSLDPLSQRAEYDPQRAAISSAHVSAINNYVRKDLHNGMGMHYKPLLTLFRTWDFQHQPPGRPGRCPRRSM